MPRLQWAGMAYRLRHVGRVDVECIPALQSGQGPARLFLGDLHCIY